MATRWKKNALYKEVAYRKCRQSEVRESFGSTLKVDKNRFRT